LKAECGNEKQRSASQTNDEEAESMSGKVVHSFGEAVYRSLSSHSREFLHNQPL